MTSQSLYRLMSRTDCPLSRSSRTKPVDQMPSSGRNREISLLREYRTRLIADVVTGKLDVREAAARLPDEVEEQEPLEETEADNDLDADAADDSTRFPKRPTHDHGHQRTRP